MPKLKKGPVEQRAELLRRWQRYWDVTDGEIASRLGISKTTWYRWLGGTTDIPHDQLVAAVNYLKIPADVALAILCTGCRRAEEELARQKSRDYREGRKPREEADTYA